MTNPIRPQIQSPLEVEYKSLVRQAAQEQRNAILKRPVTQEFPEDIVTLSFNRSPDSEPRKLKPSLSVTQDEKKALQATFSVYG